MAGSELTSALITGGTGFIGFNLATNLLTRGINVTIADNFFRGKKDEEIKKLSENKNLTIIECDLTKQEHLSRLEKHDLVFHLAAINGTKFFYEIPAKVLKTNILTTLNMLEWFVQNKGKKFVFSSSSEAYAGSVQNFGAKIPTPENVPLCIDDIFNPRWSYGGSKIAGELLTVNYGRENDFDYSIIRYHNVYGPRMGHEHVIPEFCKRIIEKENPFNVFGGEQTRAFCFVSDAVEATWLSATGKKTFQQVINIGNSKEEIKIIDLAKMIFDTAGKKPKIKEKQAKKGSIMRRCPDTSKLEKLTGFTPKVFLKEGLKITFNWYKNYFESKN